MYNVSFLTDVGLVRDHNEDAILVNKQLHLFIVADGMGGHEKGEVASQLVVKSFLEEKIPPVVQKKDEDATIVPSLSMDTQLNYCVKKLQKKFITMLKKKRLKVQSVQLW